MCACWDNSLTLCIPSNFACFCHSGDFFKKKKSTFSEKILSGIPSVLNSSDPDDTKVLSSLIWVQTFCKGYQQITLVGKELNVNAQRAS